MSTIVREHSGRGTEPGSQVRPVAIGHQDRLVRVGERERAEAEFQAANEILAVEHERDAWASYG